MSQLIIALVILAAVAAVCGYVMGQCIAFANDEYADVRAHPILHRLTHRSNPLVNLIVAFGGWALLLYCIPKGVFVLFGISDIAAFAMSLGAQILFGYLGMFVGERNWKHVA
jgi:hypothetical protein